MSKQIKTNELAEIVTGLLVRPDLMGELDESATHERFIEAIGQVVADFCGGEINGVAPANQPAGMAPDYINTPYLSVYPSESLPSLEKCVWSAYDTEGWEGHTSEELGLTVGVAPTEAQIREHRQNLQALLSQAYKAELVTTDRAPKPTIDQQYIYGSDGSLCPACGCDMIEGDGINIDCNRAIQEVSCNECGVEWVDIYILRHIQSEDFNPDDPARALDLDDA